jgi:L-cysteine/cystine lyase
MTFEEARAAFPVLERVAYLNAGSMGPLARATAQAFEAQFRREVEHGRAGQPYYDEMLPLRDAVRERIAELLHVAPARVALTSSTTDGCNIVLAGLDLGADDEVVTTDTEHPGLLGPLAASGARIVVAPTTGRAAADALETIFAAVTPRTRLLALSHVAWTTGQIFPVHELKARTGLPVLVDGAQSVGAVPVEAGEIDFYTVSCQKWLCGPEPLGALYVRDPEALRVGRPSAFSFVPGSSEFREGAARFDSGWLAGPSLAGLVAALDGVPEWRYEHAAAVTARCRDALVDAGLDVVTEPGQATLVAWRPRDDAAETVARAYKQGVVIRNLPTTGWCRASCGYWTSDDDIARLVAAVR